MPATAALVGVLQRRAASTDALQEQMAERLRTDAALTTRARQQALVADLGRLGLAGADLQRLFDRAMAGVAETFGVECCKVLELLPDGSALRLVAGVGWKEGLVGHAVVGRDRDSQAGFTLLSKDPVIVEDLRTETRFSGPPLLRDHGVVSGLSVIIGEPGHPFGVMGAHTAHRRAFTPDDVTLFQSVANVLAAAIQRKRAEEELRRVAAHLANVTAVSPAVLYTMRFEGDALVPTWVSENVTELVGYSVAEALQPGWWASHVHARGPRRRDRRDGPPGWRPGPTQSRVPLPGQGRRRALDPRRAAPVAG